MLLVMKYNNRKFFLLKGVDVLNYFVTLFALLFLVGCTDSSTPTDTGIDIAVVSPEEHLAQAISNMKEWTSYQSQFSSSSIEHPELDAYSSNSELSYIKEPFQVSKLYKDNYFGGHFESYYAEGAGFSVKNELGDQTWTTVNEPVTDNALIHAVADLLQLFVQEQDASTFTDNSAQLTITDGDFDAIRAAIDKVDELRSKLATPEAILVNIFDGSYEPTDTYEQIDVTLAFQNREITNYMITIVRDVGMEEYGPGQLDLSETFSAVNTLQEIPAPTN